ncbi:MAG: hypothetical protein ACRES9_12085 [Gammaproteobacteria bacterium]
MKEASCLLAALLVAVSLAACAPTAREAFGPRLDQARAEGLPLLIYAFGVPGEISLGPAGTAVPVYVQFVVTSDQPLKSVRFTLVGYTKRGLPVRTNDGRIKAVVMTGPGPFRPNGNYEINSFHASPAGFPGGDVGCIEPIRITVRYADGERRRYVAQALDTLLLPSLRGYCVDQGPPVNFRGAG